MNKEILNKIRDDAGFGYGVAVRLYTHDVTEMWVENDKDGEECWPSRELMEKFAELIVRECVECINKTDNNLVFTAQSADIVISAHNRSIKKIKEHFGVEE